VVVEGTPLEDYLVEYGLVVKREDLCCPDGPRFSKARGVYAHIKKQPTKSIAVLDTLHSRGGWAVAQACALLGKRCQVFFPVRKYADAVPGLYQRAAAKFGAELCPVPAVRSAILYSQVRKTLGADVYLMPNALKLDESISETASEVLRTKLPPGISTMLVSVSSGTIAAGVICGLRSAGWRGNILIHLGYSRSKAGLLNYIRSRQPWGGYPPTTAIDEGYAYSDVARSGQTPPFPCDQYYDLKAFRWWDAVGRERYKRAIFWNIG